MPPSFSLSIIAENLVVARGGAVVAAGVRFSLKPGEALVLRGENGSGKTSILRALAGFSKLQDGQLVFRDAETNLDPDFAQALQIHFVSHNNGLNQMLTIAEQRDFWAELYQGPKNILELAIDKVGLIGLDSVSISKLSAGQKRRVALMRLILSPRPLWLLDEPAAALDRHGVALLADMVAAHRAQGGIVIQTAHEGYVAPNSINMELSQPRKGTA